MLFMILSCIMPTISCLVDLRLLASIEDDRVVGNLQDILRAQPNFGDFSQSLVNRIYYFAIRFGYNKLAGSVEDANASNKKQSASAKRIKVWKSLALLGISEKDVLVSESSSDMAAEEDHPFVLRLPQPEGASSDLPVSNFY